jgi:acylphosphatase
MGTSDCSRKLGASSLGQRFDDLMPMARRSRNHGESDRDGFIKTTRQRQHPLKERWRFLIEGSVQGVGFRQYCRQRAIDLGLCGWVRNLKDGSVEVQAEGGEMALNELLLWCECGPSAATVKRVLFSKMPITGNDWFDIRT